MPDVTRPLEAVGYATRRTGVTAVTRFLRSKASLTILNYHHADGPSLDRHLSYLARHYEFVHLPDLFGARDDGRTPAGASVAITFDDGYRDVYTEAFPVLQRFSVPATVFVVTDAIGADSWFWWDRLESALDGASAQSVIAGGRTFATSTVGERRALRRLIAREVVRSPEPLAMELVESVVTQLKSDLHGNGRSHAVLTWEQILELRDSGIEIGSHTKTHAILGRLARAAAERELQESKSALEAGLGAPVRLVAYPRGRLEDCGGQVRRLAAAAGYEAALTTIPGIYRTGDDRFMVKRIGVNARESIDVLALKISGAWPMIARLRDRWRGIN